MEGDGPAAIDFDTDGAVYVDGDLFNGEDEDLVRVIVERGEQVQALGLKEDE